MHITKNDTAQFVLIDEENNKKRIDVALSNLSQFSRSMIQKMIHARQISLEGAEKKVIEKPNHIVEQDQVYSLIQLQTNIHRIEPEQGNIDILFEDEHIIVLNKSAELVVHPGAGNYSGTLINHLAHYSSSLSDCSGPERLGVVHRLDKGVSGCIIFAKTNESHISLNEQFQARTIKKEYMALSYGKWRNASNDTSDQDSRLPSRNASDDIRDSRSSIQCNNYIRMEDYMNRDTQHRKRMMIIDSPIPTGKLAIMDSELAECLYVDEKFGFVSRVRCFPLTGRMHQIRLQLASRRLPIIGDALYGKKQHKEIMEILGPRIALHASDITFQHPITKETINISCTLPKEIKAVLNYLRNK